MPEFISKVVEKLPRSEIRKIYNAANQMTGVVHLEIGDPDFKTPQHIIEAANRAAVSGMTHYTPTTGTPETREAVAAKFLRDNGIKYDPGSEVMVTIGAVGALYAACQAVLNPGDEAIVTDPYWSHYEVQIMMAGAKVVKVPLREELAFGVDLEELERAITDRTKMIIINSPNNPTGSILDEATLKGIGDLALKYGILIISDEVYEHILYDGHKHVSLASFPEYRDHVVTINSLSKTYAMTGWRMGYAGGPARIISAMAKVFEGSASCVSAVVQKAGVAALTGPQDCVKEMVATYARRRDLIVSALQKTPGFVCAKPKGAFYVFPNIKAFGMTSFDLTMALLNEAKVAVVHGSGLGDYGEGYIRLAYCTSEDNIEEALRRMQKFAEKRLG